MLINTRSEILTLLRGTMLSEAKVIELEIPESQERAFAIEICPANGYEAWELMHSMIPKTGRYPIIVDDVPTYPTPIADWEKSIRDRDFFSRYSYKGDRERDGCTSPQEIIDRAKTFDVDKYIEAEDEDFLLWQFDEVEIENILIGAIEGLEDRYGKAPTIEELLAALDLSGRELGVNISGEDIHEVKLDRWLFEWELANVDYEQATNYEGIIYNRDWLTDRYDNKYAIILLPTSNSWEALAYIHWYGSSYPGSVCAK